MKQFVVSCGITVATFILAFCVRYFYDPLIFDFVQVVTFIILLLIIPLLVSWFVMIFVKKWKKFSFIPLRVAMILAAFSLINVWEACPHSNKCLARNALYGYIRPRSQSSDYKSIKLSDIEMNKAEKRNINNKEYYVYHLKNVSDTLDTPIFYVDADKPDESTIESTHFKYNTFSDFKMDVLYHSGFKDDKDFGLTDSQLELLEKYWDYFWFLLKNEIVTFNYNGTNKRYIDLGGNGYRFGGSFNTHFGSYTNPWLVIVNPDNHDDILIKPIKGVINDNVARYVETTTFDWPNGVEKVKFLVLPNEINDDEWVENFLKSHLLNCSDPLALKFWEQDIISLYSLAYETDKSYNLQWDLFLNKDSNYKELEYLSKELVVLQYPLILLNQLECRMGE